MNVLASAVLFLFIGPFDRASSWEAKTTGEPCLVHCAVCHTLAYFGITWERTKSKAIIRFPLSSLLMTMNFSFFAFGFNTFTSVIKLLR